jgi:hypothetical protein
MKRRRTDRDGNRTPHHQPALRGTGRSEATAYHYRVADRKDIGWAICTVNDVTGELAIQSDWSNGCAFRWNVDYLGAPSLTHFLARYTEYYDYLLGKLLPPERRRVFSMERTQEAIRQRILEERRRLEISAADARDWWDDVGGIDESRPEDFYDRFPEGMVDALSLEPWYETYLEEETTEAWALRTFILPALCASCREEVARRAMVAANGPQHALEIPS